MNWITPQQNRIVPFQSVGQVTQPFQQPKVEANPIDIALGTFTESASDVSTFGVFNPDIVPAYVEQQYPISSTIGHIAGSLAGMYVSLGASFKVTRGLLNMFSFGKNVGKAIDALQLVPRVAETAKPFISSMGESVVAFALHDTAREFIRQMDVNEPDATNLVKKAIGGGVFGMFTSAPALAFNMSHPAIQALTQGTMFGVASAINDAWEGRDVMDEDYWKTQGIVNIAQGVALGLWQSKGWKERRIMSEEKSYNVYNQMMEQMQKEGNLDNPKAIKSVLDLFKEMDIETTVMNPQYKDFFNKIKKWSLEAVKKNQEVTPTRGKLKGMQKALGMSDDAWHTYLKEQTGKSSSKDLSHEEILDVWNGLLDYTGMNYAKGDEPSNLRNLGLNERLLGMLGAGDRIIMRIGAGDMIRPLIAGNIMLNEEMMMVSNYMNALKHKWTRLYEQRTGKPTIGERAKTAIGYTSNAIEDFHNRIISNNMDNLTPEMRGVMIDYRKFTDFMFNRHNQARAILGLDKIGYVDFYERALIDVPAMLRSGKREMIPKGRETLLQRRYITEETTRGTEMSRKPEDVRAQYIYHKDSFSAAVNMATLDLKKVYLDIPRVTAKRQFDMLLAQGKIDKTTYEFVNDYINYAIYNKPTPAKIKVDRAVEHFLDNNKIGQALDTWASYVNVSLRHNPVKTIINGYGNIISSAYLGLRPKVALRNAVQFTMTYGMYDAKDIARAITFKEPELFTKLKKDSLVWRVTQGQSEEHIGKAVGSETMANLNEMQYTWFNKGQIKNVDITMKASYYNTLDKIKRGEKGWADPNGIEMRKKNKDALTENEIDNIRREMDEGASNTQFVYAAWGMQMVYRTIMSPFFKLGSFTLNYAHRYLGEMTYRMIHNQPSWARGKEGYQLSKGQRFGLVRQFVGIGLLVAAFEEMGLDYSSILPISWTKKRGWKGGIFDLRPSPAVTMIETIRDRFSGDPYTSSVASKRLKDMIPVPGLMAYKSMKKAMKTGEAEELLFYKPYNRRYNTGSITVPSSQPISFPKNRPFSQFGKLRGF